MARNHCSQRMNVAKGFPMLRGGIGNSYKTSVCNPRILTPVITDFSKLINREFADSRPDARTVPFKMSRHCSISGC